MYAILAYSSVVERLTVNQDVAGSIPAMPVMSTLVQKPMSAMEEQKLAVDIIKRCPRKNTSYDAGGR